MQNPVPVRGTGLRLRGKTRSATPSKDANHPRDSSGRRAHSPPCAKPWANWASPDSDPDPRTAQPEVVGGPEVVAWAQPWERGRPRPPLPEKKGLRVRAGRVRGLVVFVGRPWCWASTDASMMPFKVDAHGRVPSPGGSVSGPSRLGLDHVRRQDAAATLPETRSEVRHPCRRVRARGHRRQP